MSPWLVWMLFGLIEHLWLRIEFAGDLALGREIPRCIASVGAGRYFSSLRDHLITADLAVANLEGSARICGETASEAGRYDLSFDAKALQCLTQSGFSAFGLANNHAADGGRGSLEYTATALADLGLKGFTGRYEARIKSTPIVVYAVDLTGSTLCDRPCQDLARKIERDSRKKLAFVFVHAGIEDTEYISPAERALARKLIRAGAAGIFGHHPHRIKSGGSIDGRPVYHSLGSVVFDRSRKPDCYGLLARVHVWAGVPLTWETRIIHMQPVTHQPIVLPEHFTQPGNISGGSSPP